MKKFESYYAISFLLIYLSFFNKDPISFPSYPLNINIFITLSSLPILFLLSKSNSEILEHFFVILSFFSFVRSFSSPKISSSTQVSNFNLTQYSHPFALASIVLLFFYQFIHIDHIYMTYFLLFLFSLLFVPNPFCC